jgi:hypothetical protein
MELKSPPRFPILRPVHDREHDNLVALLVVVGRPRIIPGDLRPDASEIIQRFVVEDNSHTPKRRRASARDT